MKVVIINSHYSFLLLSSCHVITATSSKENYGTEPGSTHCVIQCFVQSNRLFLGLRVRTAPPGGPACWRRGQGCGGCGWGRGSWPAGRAGRSEPPPAPRSERYRPATGDGASACRRNSWWERWRCGWRPDDYREISRVWVYKFTEVQKYLDSATVFISLKTVSLCGCLSNWIMFPSANIFKRKWDDDTISIRNR